MHYREMLEEAKAKGLTSEKIMWESVDDIDDMLCEMKREHPDKYHKFMRKQHGIIHGGHYDGHWAAKDVKAMKPLGEHWSVAQTTEATKGMAMPGGANEWDRYVALNAFANDLHGTLTDEQIIKAAHAFFFADKDWNGGCKVWEYMCLAHARQ